VVFAMLASYVLSRTLVPTDGEVSAARARARTSTATRSRAAICWRASSTGSSAGFSALATRTSGCSKLVVARRALFVAVSLAFCLASLVLAKWVGEDFFPSVDSGQFRLHLRAPTGTRLEETAALCEEVDQVIRSACRRRISARSSTTWAVRRAAST
jgi:multidrug efflux pump subunit AcrB